nr:MAG TPA: hypothetical protein [Caudoviricetes sp.]DAW25007.1 MAG TPA: hypothetical protein [Caudoviricetes sp.]
MLLTWSFLSINSRSIPTSTSGSFLHFHQLVNSSSVWHIFSPSFNVRFSDYPIYNRVKGSWEHYILYFSIRKSIGSVPMLYND